MDHVLQLFPVQTIVLDNTVCHKMSKETTWCLEMIVKLSCVTAMYVINNTIMTEFFISFLGEGYWREQTIKILNISSAAHNAALNCLKHTVWLN